MASKEIREAAKCLKDAIYKDSQYPAGWIANTNLGHGHFEQTLDVIIDDLPSRNAQKDMIEVDIGFKNDVVRMVYVTPVNNDAACRCDGMHEIIRVSIPKSLKVIGLTKSGLFDAISASD